MYDMITERAFIPNAAPTACIPRAHIIVHTPRAYPVHSPPLTAHILCVRAAISCISCIS